MFISFNRYGVSTSKFILLLPTVQEAGLIIEPPPPLLLLLLLLLLVCAAAPATASASKVSTSTVCTVSVHLSETFGVT